MRGGPSGARLCKALCNDPAGAAPTGTERPRCLLRSPEPPSSPSHPGLPGNVHFPALQHLEQVRLSIPECLGNTHRGTETPKGAPTSCPPPKPPTHPAVPGGEQRPHLHSPGAGPAPAPVTVPARFKSTRPTPLAELAQLFSRKFRAKPARAGVSPPRSPGRCRGLRKQTTQAVRGYCRELSTTLKAVSQKLFWP